MKIIVTEGTYNKTCTAETDLIANAVTYPEISDTMQYVEQRNLITYLVSGAKYGPDTAPRNTTLKTKIGKIPDSDLIGSNAYKHRVMGRIQKASKIVGEVGTATPGGFFTLTMEDDMLYPGMNVTFLDQTKSARVYSAGTGSTGNFTFVFQTTSGQQFNWDTWVAPMAEKKLFPGHTSYGEKSIRGYSRTQFPDTYIGHTTIQRKSCAQTGSAAATVLWVQVQNSSQKGWFFQDVSQMNKNMTLEDEYQKLFGRTNMINPDGSLKSQSTQMDGESGYPIVQGSGIWELIEGVNDSWTTGINGLATYEDFRNQMNHLRDYCGDLEGNHWIVLTGKDGMMNATDVLEEKARNDYRITINKDGSQQIGGPEITVGYNFKSLNVDGNQITFIEHPMMSDRERWQDEAIDGTKLMSGSFIFLNFSDVNNSGKKNIEIKGRGVYGINRTNITATLPGMTGYYKSLGMKPMSSVDADEYHYLKEDGLFMYNTKCCGIMHRSKA